MSDYITYDGSEQSLEQLLIWWATREPSTHAEDCEGGMHCCDTTQPYENESGRYALQSIAKSSPRNFIPITFVKDGNKQEIDSGDRIYYRGKGVYELVKMVGYGRNKEFSPIYNGYEESLEPILVWWGQKYDDFLGPVEDRVNSDKPVVSDTGYLYAIESTTHAIARYGYQPLPVAFYVTPESEWDEVDREIPGGLDKYKYEVEPGDYFKYLGGGDFKLVKYGQSGN